MRLRDIDNNQSTPDRIGTDRVEALLREAADFEPAIEPANDFVAMALSGRSRRKRLSRGVLRLTATACAGMAAAFVISYTVSRGEMRIMPEAFDTAKVGPDITLARPGTSAAGSEQASSGTSPSAAESGQDARKGGSSGAAERSNRIQTAGYEESDGSAQRAPRRGRSRLTGDGNAAVPKVRWQNEEVQRYDRGVIEPAYVIEENGKNGEVVYKPVMMPVTTETGAHPILIDGAADATMSLTSNTEDTYHK